ncbi:MAG: alcohol dehydrogenase catalytic domain-containing protein, partial [Phycisphaerae bacterium]|nr:alcohol dehydrogenase catalytic domain-containing protein [Phycisphaerae bacterium]
MSISCQAAMESAKALEPFEYEPKELGPKDIEIAITHCGVCHTDVHLIDNDWGISSYPLVPGHEIVGTVSALGSDVAGLEIGQRVGVGGQAGSCCDCEYC